MEKTNKKLWMVGGISFVAGVAITLAVLSFCCCPSHMGKGPHFGAPRPGIEHMTHRHHGAFGWNHHRFDGKRPEPTAEMKAKFAEKLGLTDAQKEQLETMRKEDMAKMEPLFKQMEDLHQEMKALRKVNREHFESVLTDAQKEILQTMKKEHKRR